MTNKDDKVRNAIMKHLLAIHQSPTSIKKVGIGIKDLRKAMKELGFSREEVISNLDYLIQKGWVVKDEEIRSYAGAEKYPAKITYKISAEGIDKFEGASAYQRNITGNQFNITGSNNLTVIGDNNIVNTGYIDLTSELQALRDKIYESPDLNEEEKISAISDVDSIRSQIQKPEVNKSILASLWNGLLQIPKVAAIIEGTQKLKEFIEPFLN